MFAGIIAEPALLTSADGFKAPLSDWFIRAASFIQLGAKLEYVKFNLIDKATGHYTNQGETIESLFSPLVVHDGGVQIPNQLTQAITLHSDVSRGRGSKGRFYPPSSFMSTGGTTNIGADGRISAANAKATADSAQELISELNAAASSFNAVVWSQLAQQARAVEKVSVGRVVDTQRRRRSSLDEDRQFATADV